MRYIDEGCLGLLEELKEKKILVEGKKDRRVLEKLGITELLEISGNDYPRILGEINKRGWKEVVVLTDFDDEGRKKFKFLSNFLRINGIKVDVETRKKFKKFFRVGKIEEIKFILKWKEKLG